MDEPYSPGYRLHTMKRKSKWIWSGIFLAIILLGITAFLSREAVLSRAGEFMGPRGDYEADVAILEGSEFVSAGMVAQGMDLLSSGRVKRLVVVLLQIAPLRRPYGLDAEYTDVLRKKLQAQGLKDTDFWIVEAPIKNPVTLTAARVVLDALAREKVRSAILLSPGFHTRRSFLAYRYAGIPYQIKILPSACFTEYEPDRWWESYPGVRDFGTEVLKLAYYLLGGYIPLKLS